MSLSDQPRSFYGRMVGWLECTLLSMQSSLLALDIPDFTSCTGCRHMPWWLCPCGIHVDLIVLCTLYYS